MRYLLLEVDLDVKMGSGFFDLVLDILQDLREGHSLLLCQLTNQIFQE